jgi:hypothetical protein
MRRKLRDRGERADAQLAVRRDREAAQVVDPGQADQLRGLEDAIAEAAQQVGAAGVEPGPALLQLLQGLAD